MAKKFFYVCAGLFLLAGAYALGARSAVAQAPGTVVSAGVVGTGNPPTIVSVSDRIVRFASAAVPCPGAAIGGPIPGSSPVVWAGPGGGGGYYLVAVLESGDLYSQPSPGGSWTLIGNLICGGPTPVKQESFGAVKARYR
jgi:hypothetical protein